MTKKTYRYLLGPFSLVMALAGWLFLSHIFAATGQLYLSPASASVQNGSNVIVTLRINPGTAVDGVEATITYDQSKLQYVSIDSSSSAFGTTLAQSGGSGSISIIRGKSLGAADISSDSLVANITFKALTGSGSSPLTLSGNATFSGAYTYPATTGNTIAFTTPPQPSPIPTPSPTPNPTPTPSPAPSPTSKPQPSPTPASPKTPAITTVGSHIEFSKATFEFSANKPVRVFIEYGTSDKLGMNTQQSELSTTPKVALDEKLLIPGTSFFYKVIAVDAQGNKYESPIQTIKTKGYTLKVTVLDKNKKPIKKKPIILFSDPVQATTDSNGTATFNGVSPGVHHIKYQDKKTDFTQTISVVSNVTTATDGTQTAAPQAFSVIFDKFEQKITPLWVYMVPVVAIVFFLGIIFGRIAGGGRSFGGLRRHTRLASFNGKGVDLAQNLNNIPTPNPPNTPHIIYPESNNKKNDA